VSQSATINILARNNQSRREERSSGEPPVRGRPSWLTLLAARLDRIELERPVELLLVIIVVGSILAVGSVHPISMVVFGSLATAALCIATWLRTAPGRRVPLSWPVLIVWALAAMCLLQVIPLPLSWLERIAPTTADIWSRSLLPLGEAAPAVAPISLDPSATMIEALRWFSYGAVFAAASVVASRRGSRWGVTLVFAAAVVAAVTTVGHGLVGAEKVFGIYTPDFKPLPWHVGPLLNPNNLAGLLNLGALCGMGLLVAENPVLPRSLVAVGVAILVGVNVTSASRGGVLALCVGVVVLGVVAELSRRRRAQSQAATRRARVLVAGAVAVGVALAILAGTQSKWAELYNENIEKLEMVLMVRPVLGDFPLLGVGRGAFESVFPAYQVGSSAVVYTHAENFLAQWLVEWGIPVTVAAVFALAWHFRPQRVGVFRSALAAGAWIGVSILLAQNLFDLGLEVPALCFAIAVALGSLWGDQKRVTEPTVTARRSTKRNALRWAFGAATVGLLLIASNVYGGLSDVASDRASLKESLLSDKPPRTAQQRQQIRSQIRSFMRRHPAEPYFPLMGALLAWQENDSNPIPWLQRALERAKNNGKAHLLLAQVLKRHGALGQALMELRMAAETDAALVSAAAKLAVRWASNDEELGRVVPRGVNRAASWDALGRFHTNRKVAAGCDRRALKLDPKLTGPHSRLANDIVQKRRSGACQEEGQACAEQLEQHAKVLEKQLPDSSAAARLRAAWMAAQGEPGKGEEALAKICDDMRDYMLCQRKRTELAARIDDPERLRKAGKALMTAACIEQQRCAQMATWIGDLHMGRQEWGSAVASYARAARDGETVQRLLKLADASSKAGFSAQAVRALEKALRRRKGSDPEIERRIKIERARALGSIIKP